MIKHVAQSTAWLQQPVVTKSAVHPTVIRTMPKAKLTSVGLNFICSPAANDSAFGFDHFVVSYGSTASLCLVFFIFDFRQQHCVKYKYCHQCPKIERS